MAQPPPAVAAPAAPAADAGIAGARLLGTAVLTRLPSAGSRVIPATAHVPAARLSAVRLVSPERSAGALADPPARAAAAGIGATVLPILTAPAVIQPVVDPNSVLRAATLVSVFRCPALPLHQAPIAAGRARSAAQLLAAAERRVLWLAVPEMWRFQEPEELSRYSDEVRVRHRLALLADDMDATVFDHATQAQARLMRYAIEGAATEVRVGCGKLLWECARDCQSVPPLSGLNDARALGSPRGSAARARCVWRGQRVAER